MVYIYIYGENRRRKVSRPEREKRKKNRSPISGSRQSQSEGETHRLLGRNGGGGGYTETTTKKCHRRRRAYSSCGRFLCGYRDFTDKKLQWKRRYAIKFIREWAATVFFFLLLLYSRGITSLRNLGTRYGVIKCCIMKKKKGSRYIVLRGARALCDVETASSDKK